MDLRKLELPDASVGTALCLDTLEHCEDPPQACRELTRVVADGGVCVLASVMLFGIHAYPSDYFRFTPEAFRSMLSGFDDVWAFGVGDPGIPSQVLAVAAKGQNARPLARALPVAAGGTAPLRGRQRPRAHRACSTIACASCSARWRGSCHGWRANASAADAEDRPADQEDRDRDRGVGDGADRWWRRAVHRPRPAAEGGARPLPARRAAAEQRADRMARALRREREPRPGERRRPVSPPPARARSPRAG